VFFISFEKSFKVKKPSGKISLYAFFNIEEKLLKIELN